MNEIPYKAWIGRSVSDVQTADAWPVRGLMALTEGTWNLDVGAPLPPLSQWLYFGPMVPQSEIGPDGHPARGGFLPPIDKPRRMWAASDITFDGRMRIGERMEKTSTIADISEKTGKSGSMIFVKVDNSYIVNGVKVLGEVQTLVYRDAPDPGEAAPPAKAAPTNAAWSRRITTDPTLLFRYSAVTFNAHRIHYDAPYVRNEEGYPNIIVHGQLTATFMLYAFVKAVPGFVPKTFSFRAMKPIYCGEAFFVEGAPEGEGKYALWARNEAGEMVMGGNVG